jgi:hypothetical protein
MAKPEPEPKPQAAGAAQNGARSSATLAGRNVAKCASELRDGRAARHLHQKSSERIATRHASVGETISNDTLSR